jgi:hypothetical protein
VNLYEIVIGVVQRDCGPEVLNLFGERIREPGQSAAVHPGSGDLSGDGTLVFYLSFAY